MNDEKNAAYTQIRVTIEALRKLAVARAAQNDLRLANLLTAEEFRLRSALAQLAAADATSPPPPAHSPMTSRMPTQPRTAAPPKAPESLASALVPSTPAPTVRPTTEADCLLDMAQALQEALADLDRVDRAWEDLIAHRGAMSPEDEDPAQAWYPEVFPNFLTLRVVLGEWRARLCRKAVTEPERA